MGIFKNIWGKLTWEEPEVVNPVENPKPDIVNPAPDPLADPPWLVEARRWEGVKETPGSSHNPKIIELHSYAKNKYKSELIAWCSSAMCAWLERSGFRSTDSEWANSYAESPYFTKLSSPLHGCIVVIDWPEPAGGHVALLDLKSKGELPLFGGNQGNAVNVTDYGYAKRHVRGYYWPKGAPKPSDTLPTQPTNPDSLPRPLKGWVKEYADFIKANVTDVMLVADKSSIVSNWKAYDQKVLIAKIFEAMAKAESNFNRTTRYVEDGIGEKDLVTGKQNVSEGLLQVSYRDSHPKVYGARFDWEKDKHLAVDDPNKTIFDPYNNLHCGILIFTKLLRERRETFHVAGRRYWSCLRPGTDGFDRFKAHLKSIL